MSVRADGTATMAVELHGWKAKLYASRLCFEMQWSVEHGFFKKQIVSGTPTGKVRAILKVMGDHTREKILDLRANRLLLLDKDGKRQYHWARVKPTGPTSP